MRFPARRDEPALPEIRRSAGPPALQSSGPPASLARRDGPDPSSRDGTRPRGAISPGPMAAAPSRRRPAPGRPPSSGGPEDPMNGLIRASLGNPYAVTVFCLTILLDRHALPVHDPGRHPAGLQEPGGPGPDLLRRDARRGDGEGHHQPDGALGRPGQRDGPAGVAIDRRRQHRPRLLPGGRRPQRGPDRRSTRWPWPRSPASRRARLPRWSCRSTRPARPRSAWSR